MISRHNFWRFITIAFSFLLVSSYFWFFFDFYWLVIWKWIIRDTDLEETTSSVLKSRHEKEALLCKSRFDPSGLVKGIFDGVLFEWRISLYRRTFSIHNTAVNKTYVNVNWYKETSVVCIWNNNSFKIWNIIANRLPD